MSKTQTHHFTPLSSNTTSVETGIMSQQQMSEVPSLEPLVLSSPQTFETVTELSFCKDLTCTEEPTAK